MDKTFRQLILVFCVAMISGLAAAHCGQCPGDKKACPADCKKACCPKSEEKKTCSADCKKACCAEPDAKKACGKNCLKSCCTLVDKKAPDFTLKNLAGKDVQLSKLKGKIVVLEWTNYDCPFVKYLYADEKKPTLDLVKKYADEDVLWLTVNSTHYATAETNQEWAEKEKIKHTVLVDSDGKVGKLYGAKTTPHVFVINKKGKVAYQGSLDNAPLGKIPEGKKKIDYVDAALAELLADKPVKTAATKPYGCSVKYAKPKDA